MASSASSKTATVTISPPSPFRLVGAGPSSSPATAFAMPLDSIELETLSRRSTSRPPSDTVSTSTPAQESWNQSPLHIARTLAVFFSLFLTGLNDASYGALVPYLETSYSLSYTVVSLVFLAPAAGYIAASLLNATIHRHLGQRGIAIITPTCHFTAYLIAALHPPFPVLVFIYFLAGLGNGVADAAWNAWVGGLRNPNQVLGVLHAMYGAGATVAPLAATALIVSANRPWWQWYWVMLAGAGVEFVSGACAFWGATGEVYRAAQPRREGGADAASVWGALAHNVWNGPGRVIWLAALFLLGYVGAEVALGGWIVTFMIRERKGSEFASGVVGTGFWAGVTLGRLVLGFVTARLGEKLSISIYLPLAAALQLLFWLVPSFFASAIAVALEGFFLGPMFPAAVVACTKLLPKHLHVPGIGFAVALGGSGGAVFPFAIGVIAQARGVGVLQPVVLALLVCIFVAWQLLPRIERKRD